MDRGKGIDGETEKGEISKSLVSSSAVLRKDMVNLQEYIDNEEHQTDFDLYLIDKMYLELKFIWTFVQLSCPNLDGFYAKMGCETQEVENLVQSLFDQSRDGDVLVKYARDHVVPHLHENIKSFISTHHHSKSSDTITEKQLVELLEALIVNLSDLPKCYAELLHPSMTHYEVLQNVCGNIRDFLCLKVNGCVDHEIVQHVLPQFQLMAERVGHFCLVILADQLDETDDSDKSNDSDKIFDVPGVNQLDETDDSDESNDSDKILDVPGVNQLDETYDSDESNDSDKILDVPGVNVKLAYLVVKTIPIELEVMHICSTNLKASKSTEVRCFIKQLYGASPNILREYLIHLQDHMVNVITAHTSAQNIHVMIEFLLIILTDVSNDLIHHDKLFDLLARVGELTRAVSILAQDLEDKSQSGESTNKTSCVTLDLLENIQLLKGDLKHVYLKVPNSSHLYFNMSDGPLFMNLLLRHLNDLLNSNAYSVALIHEEICLVREDLEFIISFFGNVEQELYKDLWTRVLDVAYEAEYAINSILLRDHGLRHLIFLLPNTIEKIKLIKEEVPKKIPKNRGLIVVNSPKNSVERKSSTTGQIIVGFKEETDWIIRKLTSGPAEIDVISIVGMAGLGKTTLAYKVYNDKSVVSHFDILAWCTVDQERNEKKLLQTIFNQIIGLKETFSKNAIDNDISDKLRRKLFGKRYLIVLDDLWDAATWDELTRPFPEVGKGSRIILTSRKQEVALQGKRHSDPLNLRLFRPEESWELLEKRVFGEESCPDELLDVAKEIAQNCQGLPLVVDLIAGVIARKEQKKSLWLEVLNNLNYFILKNEVDVMKVIQLSYDHLPDQLKPCLLYLGCYPKDKQINVTELKDLWSAEGFLEQTEMESVETVREAYLESLISSSLVTVFNLIGVEPICQIHDLVHDFCSIKSRKEMLFDVISSNEPSSSSDMVPRQMTIHYDQHVPHSLINFVMLDSEKKRRSGKHLLSLKIIGGRADNHSSDIYYLRHLRLLRVLNLDFHFITMTASLLNEICTLTHLRYLNIVSNVKALPSSFSNLWNLETLVVENRGPPVVLNPRIWHLAKLRRATITPCSFFDLDTDEPILLAEDSKLESLRILTGLQLSYSKDTEDILKRFPNLQMVGCTIRESRDCSAECNWFPKFDVFNKLESLCVGFASDDEFDTVPSVATHRWDFRFPSSLKKLVLFQFSLSSDSLSKLVRLSNLEDLSLVQTIFLEEEWNMEEDTFDNLKYLVLWGVSLARWEVGVDSFPMLEQLYLRGCDELDEVPSCFGDICSLKSIKLFRCQHLEDSALKIKKYVEDMTGEDKLQVHCLRESASLEDLTNYARD